MQFRQDSEIEASASSSFFQTSFWPKARPGDERHLVAVVAMLIFDGEQRVFLCSADDQPRNEVDDIHICRQSAVVS